MRTAMALVAVVLAAGVARAADDDAAKAKAVVEKAVAAAGWDKNGANAAQTWSDKGKLHLGGQAIDYTGEWWFSGPDKYRFEVKTKFGDADATFKVVVNGEKGWQAMDAQAEEMTAEKLEYTRDQVYFVWLYTLTPLLSEKGFTLKPIAGVKVDGAETNGVEATHKGRPTVKLYFDSKTHLLAKAEMTVKSEFDGWKETTDEVTFGGWKEADKKKHPTKMTITRGGSTLIETEQSGRKYHDKLDAKLFEELK